LDALDVMVMLPLTVPDDVGENATLKLALWPALKVSGRLRPLAVKLEVALTAEIVTLAPPEFVRVSARVCALPTCTLPKTRLLGVAVSWPAVTPVPDSAAVRAGLDALDVMVMLPLTVPDDVGENATLKLALWPALKVSGRLRPLAVKLDVALTAEIVTLAPPEFVRVSARVCALPTCTLPKTRLLGVAVSWPEPTPVPDTGKITVTGLPDQELLRTLRVMNAIETPPL
jgi:hypothetical protein